MIEARPALLRDEVWARLAGGFVRSLEIVTQVGSTNAELARAAADGAAEGTVLVAEWQRAGRGRFERVWTSPPGAGLTLSILLRPVGVPVARWPWLTLLAGVALRAAVYGLAPAGAEVALKWPNDLLLGPDRAKAAGILAEARGDAVVLGLGVNVHHDQTELPGPWASSLATVFPAASFDRTDLLVALLEEFALRYRAWTAQAGDPVSSGLRAEYEAVCDTLGREVEISASGAPGSEPGRVITGTAIGIDAGGALLVRTGDGVVTVSAGDVVHTRTARG